MLTWLKNKIQSGQKKRDQGENKKNGSKNGAGTRFQDLVIDFMTRKQLYAAYKFIGAKDPEYDGLVIDTGMSYRLARDVDTKAIVLLAASKPEALKRIDHEGGRAHIADPEHVYVVRAWKSMEDAGRVRDTINEMSRKLRSRTLRHLSLYVENNALMQDEAEEKGAPQEKDAVPEPSRRVIRMSNGALAYGLFETEDRNFKVRLYARSKKDQDDFDNFVAVSDDKLPAGVKRFLSLGQDAGEFNSLREAEDFVAQDFQMRAHRMWNGQPPVDGMEAPGATIKRHLSRRVAHTLKDMSRVHTWVKWSLPLAFSAGGALLTGGLAGAGIFAAGIAAAVGGGVTYAAGVYLQKFTEDQITHHLEKVLRDKPEKDPKAPDDVTDAYTAPQPENTKRICPKLDPEKVLSLDLLKEEDFRLRYIGQSLTRFNPVQDAKEWLFMTFSGIFGGIVYPVDGTMFGTRYPNGVVQLFDTEKNVVLARARPDMKVNDLNIPVAPLPEDAATLLNDDHIVQIKLEETDRGEEVFASSEMSPENFRTQLAARVEENIDRRTAAESIPSWATREYRPFAADDTPLSSIWKQYAVRTVSRLFNGKARPVPPADSPDFIPVSAAKPR